MSSNVLELEFADREAFRDWLDKHSADNDGI